MVERKFKSLRSGAWHRRSAATGRFLSAAAQGAAKVEDAAARAIDREEELRAAREYWHMIGADLPMEERRARGRQNNHLRPRAAS